MKQYLKFMRPSASPTWLKCTKYLQHSLEAEGKDVRTDLETQYANEGTKAHSLAERMFKEGMEIYSIEYSEEMTSYVWGYFRYVNEIITSSKDVVFNACEITGEFGLTKGTADYVILADNTLHIIDFKYGFDPVEAKDNSQLLFYALFARNHLSNLNLYHNVHNVKFHIYQPRCRNINSHLIPEYYLEYFVLEINTKMKEIMNNDFKYQLSDNCKWCKGMLFCNEIKDLVNLILTKGETMTEEEKLKVILNATNISKFIEKLKLEATTKIQNGETVSGLKLRDGAKRVVWKQDTNVDEVYAILADLGYEPEELFEYKLCSPKEASIILSREDYEKLSDFMEIKQNKPSIVKE